MNLVPNRIPTDEWIARASTLLNAYPTLGSPIEKDARNCEIRNKPPRLSDAERKEVFTLWNDKGLPRQMDNNCGPCFERVSRWLRLKHKELLTFKNL